LFFRQTFYPAGGYILDPPNAFGDYFVKGRRHYYALYQAASQYQEILRRQLQCDT